MIPIWAFRRRCHPRKSSRKATYTALSCGRIFPCGSMGAIRAGYSEKSASRIGIELLNKNHVREAVEKGRAKRAEKVERTMGVSPSWGKFRGQKSFFRWCTTIFPWGIFTVFCGRNSKGKSRVTLGIQGLCRGRLCCFRREISPAKAVFAFLAHIKKGAPRGDIRCHPLAPCSQKSPKRLPPCRAFLWLQAVSGGTTESVVWVILLTFLQLSPGERLPAPLAAVFSPSPA